MTGPAFYADDPFGQVIGPLDRVVSLHNKLLTCAAYRDYPLRSIEVLVEEQMQLVERRPGNLPVRFLVQIAERHCVGKKLV